jgi:hypothetical protein
VSCGKLTIVTKQEVVQMKLTENEVRALLGDGNITRPIRELMDGGYNLEEVKAVWIQMLMRTLTGEEK